jgi:hypothetical protein
VTRVTRISSTSSGLARANCLDNTAAVTDAPAAFNAASASRTRYDSAFGQGTFRRDLLGPWILILSLYPFRRDLLGPWILILSLYLNFAKDAGRAHTTQRPENDAPLATTALRGWIHARTDSNHPTSVTEKPGVSQQEPTILSPDSRQTDRAKDATALSLRLDCSPRSFLPLRFPTSQRTRQGPAGSTLKNTFWRQYFESSPGDRRIGGASERAIPSSSQVADRFAAKGFS